VVVPLLQLHLSQPMLFLYSKADVITGHKHVAASVQKVTAVALFDSLALFVLCSLVPCVTCTD
jgi:hypothetical protein